MKDILIKLFGRIGVKKKFCLNKNLVLYDLIGCLGIGCKILLVFVESIW